MKNLILTVVLMLVVGVNSGYAKDVPANIKIVAGSERIENISTKSFGIENSSNRFYVEITGESHSGTTYNWWVSNTSLGGSDVMDIPAEVENKEQYIAQNSDRHILHIIWEDIED